jgi:hypothetical protein
VGSAAMLVMKGSCSGEERTLLRARLEMAKGRE